MKQEYKLDKHNGEYVLVSKDSSHPTIRLGYEIPEYKGQS
jgi:hypothetical protein